MPLSICAELREESRVSRQKARNECDTRLKQLWASHALSLAMFAEKIERTYADLLRKVDDAKNVAEGAVPGERLESEEVSLLKQRLTFLQAAFLSAREHETKVQYRLDDALRTNRSKTELIAAFAHDLRQPLTVIQATLESLEGDFPPDRLPAVQRAEAAATRLEDALASLMEVARLEFGSLTQQKCSFSVNPLLKEVRDQHALDAERKGLRLKIVPCRSEVVSDPKLLGSILHNLVGNAIKYTKTGQILVGCRRRGENLSIQVEDTGIGIPEEMLGRIFDEYQQVAHGNDGYGLGLFIVKRSADLLGCPVAVRSIPGKGSCFTVKIPLHLAARPAASMQYA